MSLNWRLWLKGLISATISGGATAVSTMVVSPQEFNFQNGLNKLLTVAAVSAVMGAANYLKQSPLPNQKGEKK